MLYAFRLRHASEHVQGAGAVTSSVSLLEEELPEPVRAGGATEMMILLSKGM
jgi:hypothetical protein